MSDKTPRCRHCKREKWDHNAVTKACPIGRKGRIGFTAYSSAFVYEPKIRIHASDG